MKSYLPGSKTNLSLRQPIPSKFIKPKINFKFTLLMTNTFCFYYWGKLA